MLLSFAAAAIALAAPTDPIDRLADQYATDNRVAGLSVAIYENDRLSFAKAYGFADVEAKRKATNETLFRLASISKPITAVGAMMLVEQGKLRLDDDLTTLVPEWPRERSGITLRNVLSHTSGIRGYRGVADPTVTVFEHFDTIGALQLFANDPLLSGPGEKYAYSTHGFTVAARAIEVAAKRPFVEQMRRTAFRAARGQLDCEVLSQNKPQRSSLYRAGQDKPILYPRREDLSWKYGGGGMEATAKGLAKWANDLIHGRIVGEASLKEMWTPFTLKDGKSTGYGLGWAIGDGFVHHGGSQQGARTALWVDPAGKKVVVVLTNTSGGHEPEKLGLAMLAARRR